MINKLLKDLVDTELNLEPGYAMVIVVNRKGWKTLREHQLEHALIPEHAPFNEPRTFSGHPVKLDTNPAAPLYKVVVTKVN